jgi:hypothetical protein
LDRLCRPGLGDHRRPFFFMVISAIVVRIVVIIAFGGSAVAPSLKGYFIVAEVAAHFQCDVVVDRAGVGFLFSNTQLRQEVEDAVRLHLELPGQLVNSDFRHTLVMQA